MRKATIVNILLLVLVGCKMNSEPKNPNIIVILADDLGYGDVSSLNKDSKIPTPNIDRIGAEGVVFTDAHSSSSLCTPTRYGMLTGRYNWRSTLKRGVLGGFSTELIQPDRTTMAGMLKQQGYQTACIGKWHLGWTWDNIEKGSDSVDYSKQISNGPTTRGFDYFYGISASLDMSPYVYVENEMPTSVPDRMTEGEKAKLGEPGYTGAFWRKGPTGSDFKHEECLPNFISRASDFITTSSKKEEPYFLYLPLPAPHTPTLPTEAFRGKSGLNPYGDFVMMVDSEIGKVLEAVEQSGEAENTLIVFASDNGPAPFAELELLKDKGHHSSYIYRGHKADLFDGGHRIPCMVKWPAKLKPKTVDQTICLNDFMATFADITGYKLADDEGEDSFSLMPLLIDDTGRSFQREATVHHAAKGDFTIRKDEWKLLLSPGSGGWSYPRPGRDDSILAQLPKYQLYNMKTDPGEKNNLMNERPEIVEQLKEILLKYIADGRSTPGTPQENDGEEITL